LIETPVHGPALSMGLSGNFLIRKGHVLWNLVAVLSVEPGLFWHRSAAIQQKI